MRAHDVRHLRYCEGCQVLGDKHEFLDTGTLCVKCAYVAAGDLDEFIHSYPRQEWVKLPLNLVGVEGMQRLLALLARPCV